MSVCPRDPIAASCDATLDPVRARVEIAERFANMAQSVGDGRCLRRISVEMGARNEKVSRWESPLVDVILWAFALVATGVTVWYSLGPRPPGHGSDKDLHAVAYFVNTLAVLLALIWRPGRTSRRYDGWALPVALGILMLGGVIEIAQAGFADRDAQFGDWDRGCGRRRARPRGVHGDALGVGSGTTRASDPVKAASGAAGTCSWRDDVPASTENAHATRADQQPQDDQHDAVDRASSDQGDDLEEERKHGFRPCRRSRASRTGARAARA